MMLTAESQLKFKHTEQLEPIDFLIIYGASFGMKFSEISRQLHITKSKLNKRLKNVRQKTETANTPHLVAYCLRKGWIE